MPDGKTVVHLVSQYGFLDILELLFSMKVKISCNYKAESFNNLEESLIKHADTIQSLTIGWKPITNFLSHLKNLISLKLELSLAFGKNWNHLENNLSPRL